MPDKTFPVPKRAMAVYAHPDDVDFGCSGTLAAWIERGTHVTYCVITSGQKGTWDPKMTPKQMAQLREREQRAAGEAIGVREFVFLGHEDGDLEVTMDLRGEVCRVIREHRPDLRAQSSGRHAVQCGGDGRRRHVGHLDDGHRQRQIEYANGAEGRGE